MGCNTSKEEESIHDQQNSLALDKGYNLCPTWIYSSQCMAHFTELRRVIRENHD